MSWKEPILSSVNSRDPPIAFTRALSPKIFAPWPGAILSRLRCGIIKGSVTAKNVARWSSAFSKAVGRATQCMKRRHVHMGSFPSLRIKAKGITMSSATSVICCGSSQGVQCRSTDRAPQYLSLNFRPSMCCTAKHDCAPPPTADRYASVQPAAPTSVRSLSHSLMRAPSLSVNSLMRFQ
jgi:hypothetical protein